MAADYGEEADKIKEMIDEIMTQDIIRRKAAEVIYESAVRLSPNRQGEGEEAAPPRKRPAPPRRAGD